MFLSFLYHWLPEVWGSILTDPGEKDQDLFVLFIPLVAERPTRDGEVSRPDSRTPLDDGEAIWIL